MSVLIRRSFEQLGSPTRFRRLLALAFGKIIEELRGIVNDEVVIEVRVLSRNLRSGVLLVKKSGE
jgi:hypothetical protein